MTSVDPKLLKWWGEMMIASASNLELLQKLTGANAGFEQWYKIWESFPGLPNPPLPFPEVEQFHRNWLALFDGVPKRDYQALRARLSSAEAECERLREALAGVTLAMSTFGGLPEAMNSWLEYSQTTIKSHLEWLEELNKSWWEEAKPPENDDQADLKPNKKGEET